MSKITIIDEKVGKEKSTAMILDCLKEDMTVRELIRDRVYQEVQDYINGVDDKWDTKPPRFLMTPTELEQKLNEKPSIQSSIKKNVRKHVDWEKQFKQCCDAFERNRFFVLVGKKQAETLDEPFTVAVDTEVTFLKLTQLVGG